MLLTLMDHTCIVFTDAGKLMAGPGYTSRSPPVSGWK